MVFLIVKLLKMLIRLLNRCVKLGAQKNEFQYNVIGEWLFNFHINHPHRFLQKRRRYLENFYGEGFLNCIAYSRAENRGNNMSSGRNTF